MYTIDLLKGQGIPVKFRPESIAIASATIIVPVIIAIAMFGFYLRNRIIISIQNQEIARKQAEIEKLSDALKLQKELEEERDVISNCLSEVRSSLNRHAQWSPVLVSLVENMPESIVLTALDVKQQYARRKDQQKDDPKKTIDIVIPIRTLHMSIYGISQDKSDEAVREFRERLRSSALLGPRLENIHVSQSSNVVDGQNVVSYEIDCIFKPGM